MLLRLKGDPNLRRKFGKAGREKVLNEFNIHRSIDKLARLFATA
jgi:hypothetical protein